MIQIILLFMSICITDSMYKMNTMIFNTVSIIYIYLVNTLN